MRRRLLALGRRLPPPWFERVQALRSDLAKALCGTEFFRLRQEMDQLRADVAALLARHAQDLIDRNDAVLSNYDRRVASVANRMLDLEARVSGAGAGVPDANRILAAHEEHGG